MNPFRIDVSPDRIADLRQRIARTRWPDVVVDDWSYGTRTGFLKDLCGYWLRDYDWWRVQDRLNRLPQYRIDIEGHPVHFIHAKAEIDGALPLVLTCGWPSSFVEYARILGPLTHPGAHGGDTHDAFDVVIPSMPGYGFSMPFSAPGYVHVEALWRKLLVDVLGYPRFVAHGTDVGARVTSDLGRFHGDVVPAIHIGSVDLDWPATLPADDQLGADECDYIERTRTWDSAEGAYAHVQGTYPQTLAHALDDSPVGLASWIVEKYHYWSERGVESGSRFTMEDLVTNIMVYWLTQSMNSSMRRYYEVRKRPRATGPVATPTHIAMFPGERDLIVPRAWAERTYNICRWTDMPAGGHFPAMEEPELLVADIRAAFRRFRN